MQTHLFREVRVANIPFTALRLIIILFVIGCFSLVTNLGAKPFLWEIKHPNKPGTVYLLGSIHVLHSYDTMPPLFDTILPLSNKVMFEADIDDPHVLDMMVSRAYLTAPDTFQNYVSASTYQATRSFFVSRGLERLGLGGHAPVHFSQLRPWIIFTLINELRYSDYNLSGEHGVDRRLLTKARQLDKPVQFFESIDFQLSTLERAITGSENAAIQSALSDQPGNLVSAWLAGDDASLQTQLNEFYATFPAAAAILFDQRNFNWLPTIEAELAQNNRRTLIVVGAGHMFGNVGLLQLLSSKGYSVERLPTAPRVFRQPSTQSTILDSDVTLTVGATGTPPLSYQWVKSNNPISGATSSSLVLSSAQFSTAGEYKVVVSNGNGTTTSSIAMLTVYDANQFTPMFMRSDARKLGIWLMDTTNCVAAVQLHEGKPYGPAWKPVGSTDFNQDTHSDILFQHTDGRLAAWLMRGATLQEAVTLKSPAAAWRVACVTDYDGDEKADIIFRNRDGRLAVWLMDGTNFLSGLALNGGKPVGLQWRLVSAAHFDNDGKADLLWQNRNGALALWMMDGPDVISKLFLRNGLTLKARAVAAREWDGDGETDILFQKTNGQLSFWKMNDMDFVSAHLIENARPLPNPWRVFGAR